MDVDQHLRGYKNNKSNTKQSQEQDKHSLGHTTCPQEHLVQIPEKIDYNSCYPIDQLNDMLLARIRLIDLIKAKQLANNLVEHKPFWEKLLKFIKNIDTNKPTLGSKTTEHNTGREANTIVSQLGKGNSTTTRTINPQTP